MKHKNRHSKKRCDSFTRIKFEGSMLCPKVANNDVSTYRGCKICGYDRHPNKFGGTKKTHFNKNNLDASIIQKDFTNDPEY